MSCEAKPIDDFLKLTYQQRHNEHTKEKKKEKRKEEESKQQQQRMLIHTPLNHILDRWFYDSI